MENLGLNEIRLKYANFFENRKHTVLKSYSLIPESDKSLLLINAGMAPLKTYFTGEKKMPNDRATSCQRCLRTQDIDNVGKTDRHATFFEMLGNFSFGNYFKREAINWAFEFLTQELMIEKDKLWTTVYVDDHEAYKIWNEEIGIPKDRILKMGKEDNFWELEEGPCGPCSEIFVDRGPAYGKKTSTHPGSDDSDRFMEVWNLVFTQFNKNAKGEYEKLAHPNIDTGMGLERITMVMEGKNNIFELDAFKPILNSIENLSGKKYGKDDSDESIRVLMDHSKAMTFLVYDGVIPSNEQRGYVLRKLIRRAYRHGKLMGIKGEFLSKILDSVIDVYREEYPELIEAKDRISKIIIAEESKFQETIDQGLEILDSFIDDMKSKKLEVLDGEKAFKLYDTYGFPLDLTREILAEKNLKVDEVAFSENMKKQKELSRKNIGKSEAWVQNESLDLSGLPETNFKGYETFESKARVLKIFSRGVAIDSLKEGEEATIILDTTSFYGEGGGQVGDKGILFSKNFRAEVEDTKKDKNNVYMHIVKVEDGKVAIGDELITQVDADRRRDIMRNHSATHLLHKALKTVLGDHVNQAGSYVDEHKLRFDFSHFEQINKNLLTDIEKRVNEQIAKQLKVETINTSIEESKKYKAIGLFEDKYKEVVRIVKMGDYSTELCGGTHVSNTSEILMFKILSESGVAAGVRRIEAVTGREVYRHLLKLEDELVDIQTHLKTRRDTIKTRIDQLIEDNNSKDLQIKEYQKIEKNKISESLTRDVKKIKNINLLTHRFDDLEMDQMREISESLSSKLEDYVIVLASSIEGKILFTTSVDKKLNKKGLNAGSIVKFVANITGGNGGGRPDFASAGGKDIEKVDEALDSVESYIEDNYKE